MLTIFRRIRKSLIDSSSTRKYILYAIGEIALVVIGILIALQVNKWNENRQKMAQSKFTKEELKMELTEAKSALIGALVFNNKILRESQLYIYGKVPFDSILHDPEEPFRYTNYAPLKLDLPIVLKETSSDRLIIGEYELSQKLLTIKALTQRLENSLSYMDEFWNNEVAPFYIRSGTMVSFHMHFKNQGLDITSREKLFKDEEYKNIVAMSNLLISGYIQVADQLKETIDETLGFLTKS